MLNAVNAANENGAFMDSVEDHEKLIGDVTQALKGLSDNPPKIGDARKTFSLVAGELSRRVNSKPFGWRFVYGYGGPAFLYYIAIFLAITLVWLFFPTLLDYNFLWVPSWAFVWGTLGAVLNGFWKVWQHAAYRQIRKYWYTWYLLLPLIGAILGAITYLILLAGLIATTGGQQTQSQFLLMLLCALGGFNSEWAVSLLDKLTEIFQISK